MIKKIAQFSLSTGIAIFMTTGIVLAAIGLPPPEPTDMNQCKKNGWRNYGEMFKNQGDCVSFVVTAGRNAPDGPPVH